MEGGLKVFLSALENDMKTYHFSSLGERQQTISVLPMLYEKKGDAKFGTIHNENRFLKKIYERSQTFC